jgi:endonuclease/exonuclease/phosphatase family metal-dependent hydrolase
MKVRVQVFNIEHGGTGVDFSKVAEAVKRSGADVVGIEEADGNIPRLAKQLGWSYYDVRMQIVSRFPLIDPPGGDGVYTFVEPVLGYVFAMENVHLPSAPYGPRLIQQGASAQQILKLERRTRLAAVKPSLAAARKLEAQHVPVFLTGDFNTPSYRDWTPATVGARPQMLFPMRWPVSIATEKAGFVDSFRAVYPDPVTDPGLTWPAKRPNVPGWDPGVNSPADRIDFVYASGAKTLDSRIVGERHGPEVSVPVDPWPSDHRSVVSTFEIRPAVPPTLVAVDSRLVRAGHDLRVTFHAPPGGGDDVVVVPEGGKVTDAIASRSTEESGDAVATSAGVTGSVGFQTSSWKPEAYEAVLVGGRNEELARIPFWVEAPDAKPEIATTQATYRVGESIGVHWRNAPGNRWDWIGVYPRAKGPDKSAYSYLLYTYTGSTIQGSAQLNNDAHGHWPLSAGRYTVYLLRDDGYHALAGADFTVRG